MYGAVRKLLSNIWPIFFSKSLTWSYINVMYRRRHKFSVRYHENVWFVKHDYGLVMNCEQLKAVLRSSLIHNDVIEWKHFPRNWPFVRGIHRSPVNSPHTGQWRGALMLSLICVWINDWVNKREAGDLRRYRTHYDVIVMLNNGTIRLFAALVSEYLEKCLVAEVVSFKIYSI